MATAIETLTEKNASPNGRYFTFDRLKDFQKNRREPKWMAEFRRTSFEIAEKTGMPDRKDEAWRRTDLRGFEWKNFTYNFHMPEAVGSIEALPSPLRDFRMVGDNPAGGVLMHVDGLRYYRYLNPEMEKAGVEDILHDLRSAGLDSMPGGGAEIFRAEVRAEVCPSKISGERWLEIHRIAHGLGLKTNATMLYGHVESYADRVDHLLRLRETQDATGGFQAFIPLAFQPKNSALSHLPPTTGVDDLKTLAVSRLLLDNFLHIKTYWIMTGLKLAQVALFFGANDMDGTVVEEVISLMSEAGHGQAVARTELVRVIRNAGRAPVERDALYQMVRRYEGPEDRSTGGLA